MLNWRKVCTVLSVLLLSGILWLNLFGSPLAAYHLKQDVKENLAQQGYHIEELSQFDVMYDRDGRNKYMVKVVYSDSPNEVHYYCYDGDQELQELEQIGK